MREYVKVYCCGDCIYYNLKKHKCSLGARDEGEAQDHFYRDCPLGIHIEQKPTVDAVPAKHGKFIGTEYDGYADGYPVYYEWKCSECGCVFEDDEPTYNYCPNCGAKMERKEE